MKIAYLMFALFTLLIAGCGTERGFQKLVHSWYNKTEVEIIRHFGIPDQKYTSGNSTFLAYESEDEVYFEGSDSYVDIIETDDYTSINSYDGFEPSVMELNCYLTFEFKKGRVVNSDYYGNSCVD